jgi:hypothetical protein
VEAGDVYDDGAGSRPERARFMNMQAGWARRILRRGVKCGSGGMEVFGIEEGWRGALLLIRGGLWP